MKILISSGFKIYYYNFLFNNTLLIIHQRWKRAVLYLLEMFLSIQGSRFIPIDSVDCCNTAESLHYRSKLSTPLPKANITQHTPLQIHN